MEPVCVGCFRKMRCVQNEFFVKDRAPSTYWSGDLYECPDCGKRVIVGFGRPMTAETAGADAEDAVEVH